MKNNQEDQENQKFYPFNDLVLSDGKFNKRTNFDYHKQIYTGRERYLFLTYLLRTLSASENLSGGSVASKTENYAQLFETSFTCIKTDDNRFIFKGDTERSRLRQTGEILHGGKVERAYLLNGPGIAGEDKKDARLKGLETMILGSMENVHEYDTNDYSQFLNWAMELFSSKKILAELKMDLPHRLLLGNNAMEHWINELEKERLIKTEWNDVFAVPGVKKITRQGTFDFLSHPILNEKYEDRGEPYGMALHPLFLQEKNFVLTQLMINMQESEKYKDIHEDKQDPVYFDLFRTQSTILMHYPELHGIYRKKQTA